MCNQATAYVSLTVVNTGPVFNIDSHSVTEDPANGITVIPIVATDKVAQQTRTFSILSGNISGAIAINASTGVLRVVN